MQRDMQQVLGTVGAMLDRAGARSVYIHEDGDALVIRARVPETLSQDRAVLPIPVERSLSVSELARVGPADDRDPDPGRHERSLRAIGRRIDDDDLDGFTLMEDGLERAWLLWHRRMPTARPEVLRPVADEPSRSVDLTTAVA